MKPLKSKFCLKCRKKIRNSELHKIVIYVIEDKFLREHVFSKVEMMTLFVDLVGSTQMTLELPEDKLAIIISSFAQEMGSIIKQFGGYVLKFVGDAVVGYFVAEDNSLGVADNVVNCAKSMITVIKKGINPILNQYDYPDLRVTIGIDFGKNIIVRYGADKERSQVDIMGPAVNITAKIQALAKPNQILIGDDVYKRLHPSIQKRLNPLFGPKMNGDIVQELLEKYIKCMNTKVKL